MPKINHDINFLQKRIRAREVKKYMVRSHMPLRVLCITCGNAGAALKAEGFDEVHTITKPPIWYTQADIARIFPAYFDATSGHLPIEIMWAISTELRAELVTMPKRLRLPTGSGETLVCLKMAFPKCIITPVYDLDDSTRYHTEAPLNNLVTALTQTHDN